MHVHTQEDRYVLPICSSSCFFSKNVKRTHSSRPFQRKLKWLKVSMRGSFFVLVISSTNGQEIETTTTTMDREELIRKNSKENRKKKEGGKKGVGGGSGKNRKREKEIRREWGRDTQRSPILPSVLIATTVIIAENVLRNVYIRKTHLCV